jgi:signal transduction histidine kinase
MKTPTDIVSEPLNPSSGSSPAFVPPRLRWYGWPLLLAVGPLLLLLFRLVPALDQPMLHSPFTHLLIVGGASLLGMALALFVLRVARQVQDGRVYLVGMGFLSIASIFFIHAISTPDVLMTGRGLATGWSAVLSLVLGAVFFALSGLDLSSGLNRLFMRYARAGVLLFLIFWLVYSAVFLVLIPMVTARQSPDATPGNAAGSLHATHAVATAPPVDAGQTQSRRYDDDVQGEVNAPVSSADRASAQVASVSWTNELRDGLAIVGLACYAFAVVRHARLYRRSPSTAGLAIVCGIGLFGEALLTQQLSQVYMTSFWLYHAEEFIGFGVISYAGLLARRRGQTNLGLLDSMFLAPTRSRIQAAYAQAMDLLVDMLSRGEEPSRPQLQDVQRRFGLSETQVSVVERAALAVAHERRQRQELERLNAALRQLEQDKEQLIQMVVHDLKNPLTALIGFLEILRMDHLTGEQLLLLDGALRSGKNLSSLIGDLLDVSRAEEGQLELDRAAFAPRELLTDCAAEMSAWLAQDGKTIRIEAPADLPTLHADLRLIRRVVLNLLSNAIKHTPPGTYIALRACVSPEASTRLAIEVADTGPGIPPEHLEQIFQKFGRVNSESNGRQESTGLGLTFCRLAVEAHGGTIGVCSTVGQGATFRITLPLA